MIDLRSDTVTQPTEEMREAMYHAEVGDDVYEEDPTVNELEALAASLLGKEAALFVTSGTQGNQVAVLSHTRPGEEVILEAESHIFYYEAGAVASLAGVQTKTINSYRGQMSLDDIREAIRGDDIHLPKTSLICLENTHNRAGGAVLPLDYMREVHELAQSQHIPVHLDGARLFNAAVALGVELKDITQHVETVQVCLSKGLSAPMGSILAGPKKWIQTARKWRKRLGGGMRQVGFAAAPGIIALTQMVDRLQEDHEHAKVLAEGLSHLEGIDVDVQAVETNIVLIGTKALGVKAADFVLRMKENGILANAFGPYTIRLMTHREITTDHVEKTIRVMEQLTKHMNQAKA